MINFERSTHTLFEPGLQKFFLPAHWMIDIANQLYLNAQFSIALGFLIWLYLFRNESYYFVRNMFVVAMCLALIGYIAASRPRRRGCSREHGFVDTITKYSTVNHNSSMAKIFINPYAAVPSMHCAFALMIGAQRRRGLPPPVGESLLGGFWPMLIAWVVIVTANHYWVDAALGWLVALASARSPEARWPGWPEAWAWRRAARREAEA